MATHENPNPNSILLDELIYNILSRLPVKTLLRFRSVCKSWSSLISTPEFIKTHLSKSNNETHTTHHHLILSEVPFLNHGYRGLIGIEGPCEYLRFESCSLHSLLNEHESEAIELDYPMKDIDRFTYVVGSSNGLICLACFDGSTFLWNPSTRKSRRLPNYEYEHTVCGFGYDESNDEFKVFAFIAYSRRDLRDLRDLYYKASVYGSKSDCWRLIKNLSFGEASNAGTLANGAINWVVKKDSDIIVSLDIETEIYREIMLPQDKKDLDSLTLHTLGKKLCVVYYIGNTHADFWIMNEYGVEESWTKLFKFSYMDDELPWNPRLIPVCFFSNGDILMFMESAIVRYKPKDNTFEILLQANDLSEPHVNVWFHPIQTESCRLQK